VYAEGVNGAPRRDAALELLTALPKDFIVVPAQALGELFHVLVRKAGRSRAEACAAALSWQDAYTLAGTSPQVMLAAFDLATHHNFGIWDAVILSAASHAGCRLLLTEDLHDGFTWSGLTVVNPFASPRHPLLITLLDGVSE